MKQADNIHPTNDKELKKSSNSFYDGRENLMKGVRINTDMGPREAGEDLPTVSYNPGDVVSIFYSGFQR